MECEFCKKLVPFGEYESHIHDHLLELQNESSPSTHSNQNQKAGDEIETVECEYCNKPISFKDYESHVYAHQLEMEQEDESGAPIPPPSRLPPNTTPYHRMPPSNAGPASSSSNADLLQLPVTSVSTSTTNTNGRQQTITTTYRRLPDGRDFVVIEQTLNGRVAYRREEFRNAREVMQPFQPHHSHHQMIFHTPHQRIQVGGLGGFGGYGGGQLGGAVPNIDQMGYNELLQLQDRLGVVKVGLTREQFDHLPLFAYHKPAASAGAGAGAGGPVATEDTMCSVCQTEFVAGEDIKCTPCIHKYHPDCLWNWLKDNSTCPVCKRDLKDE